MRNTLLYKAKYAVALSCIAFILSALNLRAEVKLPSLLSDGMVLQQGMKVNIWGTADPGDRVTVSLKDQSLSGVADSKGHWQVKLSPLSAGGPFTLTVAGRNTITLHDVLVGEVWVCSGQSNMEMPVGIKRNSGWSYGVDNYRAELDSANYPMLRLFTVQAAVADKPQADVTGHWIPARPDTVNDFSAVGYFFAREMIRVLNVPIGMIHSSWGGTPAETWTSRGTLESDPDFKDILENGTKLLSAYPKAFDDYGQRLAQWRQDSDKAEADGSPVPPPPPPPMDPRSWPLRPAGLYNAMIVPLTRYAIRGVIWYQGESNSNRPIQYRKLFPLMIQDWRRAWGEGDLPFLFVQLANYGVNIPQWNWPELREAQLMALSLPKTGMAVAIDIGDGIDIHPRNKQDVGYRLALAAQAIAYGRDVMYSGPIFESMEVEGENIRLHFKHVYGGLELRSGPPPNITGDLRGSFEIAGDDDQFVGAEARIDGETVLVHNGGVTHPVAVRFAWMMNPLCNLYNKAGLPASPFRTDNWEDSTPIR